uniref:Histone H1-delta n=1 Tax=Schistosoma japonicum TaxID=6182 RepID=C1LBZ3_SCHJA|nr:Histone H1-delta [Schistosoma japonicum]
MTVSAISGGAIAAAPLSGGTKKSTKSKKTPSAHPPYGDMIKKALKELKERGGSSRQAIAKYIKANYKVDDRAESHLRRALVTGVKSGKIVHTKGIGASGSFKLQIRPSLQRRLYALRLRSRSLARRRKRPPRSQKLPNQSRSVVVIRPSQQQQPSPNQPSQRLLNRRRQRHLISLKPLNPRNQLQRKHQRKLRRNE